MKLIDKNKLLEELKKLKQNLSASSIVVIEDVESLIESLEEEENDVMEEIDYENYARFFKEYPDYNDGSWGFEETRIFAQYFYTLGLKAQKGE